MQRNKYAVFMDPAKMARLRELGMSNFSGWVNYEVQCILDEVDKVCLEICDPKKREDCTSRLGKGCMYANVAAERIRKVL